MRVRRSNPIVSLAQHTVTTLRDLIAPPRCLGCLVEGTWLCRRCHISLQHRAYVLTCPLCSRRQPRGFTCNRCRTKTHLTGAVTAGPYHTLALQRGVRWLKFKRVRAVAEPLATLLIPHLITIAPLLELQQRAVLIPIPLYKRRLRERSFNQSLEIANHLSRLAGIPVHDILARHRTTWTQSHLPTELRKKNLTDAFALKKNLSPDKGRQAAVQPIAIIIDDVSTSGATLSAAAAALSTYPFQSIWGATVAKG